MLDTPTEFIFEGYGHTYRVDKKLIENCKHNVVDIAGQKIYNKDESQAVNGTFTNSSSDREIHETTESSDFNPNNLNSINISAIRTEHTNLNTKNMIERFLKTKISNSKRVKNQSSNTLETVLKTQRELSDEMASLLEELEEDYLDEGKIDYKTYIEYKRHLKEIYRELIANAPFEKEIIDEFAIEANDKQNNWQLEIMEKYGMTLEKLEEALSYQQENVFDGDEIESIDSRRIK